MHEDEFMAFVDGQSSRLLGYARALTGNDHDAWDLVQETLVRMGRRWSRIERDGNPSAYARTTLVRINIDRHRRSRREHLVAEAPDSAAPSPELGIEPWLLAALRSLPRKQRTALVLRYVDDLDHQGVAEVMGCAVGTARSHVSRGLAALRAVAPAGSQLASIQGGGRDA
jgi:RNA polymerase sigma-70 factor (sigma-E family)